MGSVGVKIGFMLRGGAEVYCRPGGGTKLWDSAGPEAILTAAGGTMTDLDGAPLDYMAESIRNPRGILATVGVRHGLSVARASKLFPKNLGKSE
jgi:3'(2'), 5'-bisphosphate nucleotidase